MSIFKFRLMRYIFDWFFARLNGSRTVGCSELLGDMRIRQTPPESPLFWRLAGFRTSRRLYSMRFLAPFCGARFADVTFHRSNDRSSNSECNMKVTQK